MPFYDPNHPLKSHARHLPHWQQDTVPIFITWSLADSLPKEATKKIKARKEHWLGSHPKPWTPETEKEYYLKFANPINEMLDKGRGECVLRDPRLARIVADHLLAKHSRDYNLHSFVIMPNHVHVLVTIHEGVSLPKVLHSWKGASSRKINLARGKRGKLWHQEYWDRLIRSRIHFEFVIRYIRDNPMKAHLPPTDFLLWESTELGL